MNREDDGRKTILGLTRPDGCLHAKGWLNDGSSGPTNLTESIRL